MKGKIYRIISVMLLIVFVFPSAVFAASENEKTLIVSQVTFTDSTGQTLSSLANNSSVKASLYVKGTTDNTVNAKLIAAYYEYGFLKWLKSEDISVEGKTTEPVSVTIQTGSNSHKGKIKVFVWESYEGNTVLSNCGTYNSSDAGVSDILIDGASLTNFDSSVYEYDVALPASAISYPDIDVITDDLAAKVEIEKAAFPGEVKISVSSCDETVTKEYKLNFTVNKPSVSNVKMYFGSETKDVTAIDTNVAEPVFKDTSLTGSSYYAADNVKSKTLLIGDRETYLINIAPELLGSTIISGSQSDAATYSAYVKDGSNEKLMTFDITGNADVYYFLYANSPSYDRITWAQTAGFTPCDLSVSWVEGKGAEPIEPKTNLVLYKKSYFVSGKESETVTIGGQKSIFVCPSVIIKWKDPDDYAILKDITLDGKSLEGFDPSVTAYDITLPYTATGLPEIKALSVTDNAVVTVTPDNTNLKATVNIKSANGNEDVTYTLNFKIAANPNKQAEIKEIKINGTVFERFSQNILEYKEEMPEGASSVPEVTATATIDGASVDISYEGKTAVVKVTSKDGTVSKTYKIKFAVSGKITDIILKQYNATTEQLTDLEVTADRIITTGYTPPVFKTGTGAITDSSANGYYSTANLTSYFSLFGDSGAAKYNYLYSAPDELKDASYIKLNKGWREPRKNASNPLSQYDEPAAMTFKINKSAVVYYIFPNNSVDNVNTFAKWLNDYNWNISNNITVQVMESSNSTSDTSASLNTHLLASKAYIVPDGQTATVNIGGFLNNYFTPMVFVRWVEDPSELYEITNAKFKMYDATTETASYIDIEKENIITTGYTLPVRKEDAQYTDVNAENNKYYCAGNLSSWFKLVTDENYSQYSYFHSLPDYLHNADYIRLTRTWREPRKNANTPNAQNAQSEVLTFDINKTANVYYIIPLSDEAKVSSYAKWLIDEEWTLCSEVAPLIESTSADCTDVPSKKDCLIYKKKFTVEPGNTVNVKIGGFLQNYWVPFVFVDWDAE